MAAVCNSSAGSIGFKGSVQGGYRRKAAQQALLAIAASAARDQFGMKSARAKEQWSGSGFIQVRAFGRRWGLHIVVIRDVTPIWHNGCRLPKQACNANN